MTTPIFDNLAPHPHFALELSLNLEADAEQDRYFEETFSGFDSGPGLPW